MVFIVILYLIWNALVKTLQHQIYLWSLPHGVAPKSKAEEIVEESHGAVYVQWLHALAVQMMVCIFVFITVWVISQTPSMKLIP